ncbi:MAG: sulfotransferase, partial [Gammaproteobacteria bacterium]|nr:sulfotransferase [Gammaproteobacteria bacterium]
ATALFDLSQLTVHGKYNMSKREMDSLLDSLDDSSLDSHDRSLLHFAYADLQDSRENYDKAFEHYTTANELRSAFAKPHEKFQQQAHVELVDKLIDVFDKAFMEKTSGYGIDSELPVFIVGMPRSGTSLVEQILASHPDVRGAGELMHIIIIAHDCLKQRGSDLFFPDTVRFATPETIQKYADQYVNRQKFLYSGALRVTDKLPQNFIYLGIINMLFPKARIIHIQRNAMDTCWSCYRRSLRAKFTMSLEDIAVFYNQYKRLMAHWNAVLPEKILNIEYEELTDDLARVSRQMIEFLGLEWHDGCLDFGNNDRAVGTASSLQVREPISKKAIDSWQHYAHHLKSLEQSINS